jgi:hypothetical protein
LGSIATAQVLVDHLAGRGIVERRVSETDRRARLLRLTANGERLFRQVRKGNLAAQARALALLTRDERELLHDLLTRLVAANGAHARPGAGRAKLRAIHHRDRQARGSNLGRERFARGPGGEPINGPFANAGFRAAIGTFDRTERVWRAPLAA